MRRWKIWLLTTVLTVSLCACTSVCPAPDPEPEPVPPAPVEEKLPENPPIADPAHFLAGEYPEIPVFDTKEQVASYMIYNLLQGKRDMEFYLDRSIGDDWDAYCMMDEAQESTCTYNLFGAYIIDTMYAEDLGEEQGLHAYYMVSYPHDDYDEEARAEAWAYVRNHIPPKGGFTDFESEKAYALEIHDYLARKVTYNSIGDDQEKMAETFDYDAFQEAYNVLGKDQDTAVCAGYSRAFALIAQYAGIHAVWVRGNHQDDGSSHAWNVIYPCDGSAPVSVDVTWDDVDSEDGLNQTDVMTEWFYIPVSEDFNHSIEEGMVDLLDYVNAVPLNCGVSEIPADTEDAVG